MMANLSIIISFAFDPPVEISVYVREEALKHESKHFIRCTNGIEPLEVFTPSRVKNDAIFCHVLTSETLLFLGFGWALFLSLSLSLCQISF